MGIKKLLFLFLALGALSAGLICYVFPELLTDPEVPKLEDEWWGKVKPKDATKIPKDNPAITKYTIHVDDAVLKDLDNRLKNTRFIEPLENVQFQYGFHASYLRQVVEYWKTKYDWKKQEKELNKFNHFTTQIEGIDVHFIHSKPAIQGKKVRVLPLLLIHGWPGSVVEFQKILPLLTTVREDRDYVFEVICPSIPGYGFSEAPHQPGFSVTSAARVFVKLMQRLGHEKYYVQGGDWGSLIASVMSQAYPERINGLHLNLANIKLGVIGTIKYLAGYIYPSLFMTPQEYSKLYPFMEHVIFFLEELGYMHIQATKPDTIGSALADTPAGLAAYILEKFSTWTDASGRSLPDGGLSKKFTLDELLTNVMVYWSTNSIASSARFYKEFFNEKCRSYGFENIPVKVPTGVAAFPHELIVYPEYLLKAKLRNIVRYSTMPRGGHFAAMEEPKLLADDIWEFAVDVEREKLKKN